jgi:hypothetical protein
LAATAAAGTASNERRSLFARRRPHDDRELVAFPDLVRAHHRRQRALRNAEAEAFFLDHDAPEEQAYRAALRAFQAAHGPLVAAHWCVSLPSAIAVTSRPPRRLVRWLDWIGWSRRLEFHRASDWSTQPSPRAAALLHRCDALAVRVGQVLTGTPHKIAMGLVGRSAGNLLSLVDAPSGPGEAQSLEQALDREEARLDETEGYYRRAAVRQAQLVYIAGMLLGALALVGVTLGLLRLLDVLTGISWSLERGVTLSLTEILGVATAGALGAIVSVIRRVDGSSFAVDHEIGRLSLVGLGMIRPLMGAVFGLALYAAIVSGLLDLFALPEDPTAQFFFFLAIGFVSGFSERLAEDTLLAATDPGEREPPPVPPAATPTSAAGAPSE